MGNMIIGQSGGPTAVINASLAGAYSYAKEAGISKVYGMLGGIQGLIEEKYINLDDFLKTPEDISILRQTPSAALGSCRFKLPPVTETELYEKIFAILKKLDIAYFIYIGGNDSMDTIDKLSQYASLTGSDIRFMGVPKTIDNDLPITDHTPGYGSAAKYISTAVKEIIGDSGVYYLKSITVIEIMGRNAGWLAATAALSKGDDCCGPDMIYLPEYSFDIEECEKKISELFKKKNAIIIAVSEALKDKDGNLIGEGGSVYAEEDAFGHKIMSGVGQFLAQHLGKKFGVKARGIEINTLQRCAAHYMSAQDNDEAFAVGAKSAKAAISGETGKITVIIRTNNNPYSYEIKTADIGDIANIEKKLPLEWIDIDNAYIRQEFIDYCLPLIQGEIHPIMKNGLPVHTKFIKS
ncbi:MAG: 6-phosphofructokinase [Clostridia bacterium]|nr:6-phosphofructokinase [Clostridia bacterium]